MYNITVQVFNRDLEMLYTKEDVKKCLRECALLQNKGEKDTLVVFIDPALEALKLDLKNPSNIASIVQSLDISLQDMILPMLGA